MNTLTTGLSLWPLLGVAWVIAGFALRINPAVVAVSAGLVTGLIAGEPLLTVLELFGTAFVNQRYLLLFLLTLPVIGLLERHGLKQHASAWIARLRRATLTRLLIAYLGLRQVGAMLGLVSLGGHPQTVRPLLAPMAEAAARARLGHLDRDQQQRIRALCAGTDNVGLFFGEDVFVAFGAVLLMQGFYAEHGIQLEPLQIALWGLPTAACAFIIQSWRIRRFEQRMIAAPRPIAASDDPSSGPRG